MMDTGDYDDTLPKGYHALPGGGNFPWPLAVAPYVKNTAIFRCPSDRNPMPVKWMRFRQTLSPEGGTEGSLWVQALMRHVP